MVWICRDRGTTRIPIQLSIQNTAKPACLNLQRGGRLVEDMIRKAKDEDG